MGFFTTLCKKKIKKSFLSPPHNSSMPEKMEMLVFHHMQPIRIWAEMFFSNYMA